MHCVLTVYDGRMSRQADQFKENACTSSTAFSPHLQFSSVSPATSSSRVILKQIVALPDITWFTFLKFLRGQKMEIGQLGYLHNPEEK